MSQKPPFRSKSNDRRNWVNETWEGSNQEWWDWYVSLAHQGEAPVGEQALIAQSEQPLPKLPSMEEFQQELATPYPLSEHQIRQFQTQSYIRLKNVFSVGTMTFVRQELERLFAQYCDASQNQQFSALELVWQKFIPGIGYSEVISTPYNPVVSG